MSKAIVNRLGWHWHGNTRFPVLINDPRCPVCNADGHLSSKDALCKCGHSRRQHVYNICSFRNECDCEKFSPENLVEAI